MRTITIMLAFVFTLAGMGAPRQATAQPGFRAEVSFNTFYNELSPHGQWMELPRYGKVWRYREAGFRPYLTNGQWAYTDIGWAWESGYDWGWAPFHYGRWELDDYYGWIWIPGYDYAPAWVSWSQADDYYGWAPLGFGLDINISIGRIPSNRWMYASRSYIYYPNIDRYCLPYNRNAYYVPRQRPIGNIGHNRNTRYFSGPSRHEVERYANTRIQPRSIDNGRRYDRNDNRNDNRTDRPGYAGRNPDNRVRENDRDRQTPERPYAPSNRDADRNIARVEPDNRNRSYGRERPDNNGLQEERQRIMRQREQANEQQRQQSGEQFRRQQQERMQQMQERQNQSAPQRIERNNGSRPSPSISSPRANDNGERVREFNSARERPQSDRLRRN